MSVLFQLSSSVPCITSDCRVMSLKLSNAEKYYAQDLDLKKEDVLAIFEWLKKQPHLPEIKEVQVLMFLKSCHHSVETAKKLIDNYFTIRTHCPDVFESADEKIIREVLSVESICVMPKKTPEGYLIMCCKLMDLRPEKYVCINHFKVGVMVLTQALHQRGPANGIVMVGDSKGATIGHLARANLAAIKKVMYYIQEAAPIQVTGLHYVNVNTITEKALGLIKPFLKKELCDLINLHSNFDTLHKCIPKECLPEEYGGELPSIPELRDENVKRMIDDLDFFQWHDTQQVDESKRSNKTTNQSTIFGIEGNFKKLEID